MKKIVIGKVLEKIIDWNKSRIELVKGVNMNARGSCLCKTVEFTTQIYIDAKPENYAFSNKTKNMTEKEVLEAFGIWDE